MLPIHKRMLTILVVMLLLSGGIYWVVLRPIKLANEELRSRNEQRQRDLRQSGYTLEPVQLEGIRTSLQKREGALQNLLSDVYDESMAQFHSGIQMYETVVGLRRGISQLDYQEIYNRIRKKLTEQGVHLVDEKLGISEQSTAGENTYRLVVHMWVVDALADLIVKHKLDVGDRDFQTVGEAGLGQNQWPANISVQPVRVYAVSSGEAAMLEEYPVKIVVRGQLPAIAAFITDLTSNDRFLPLDSAAIERIPGRNPADNLVKATLTCSGFLITRDKSEFRINVQSEQRHNVPPPVGGM